MLILHTYEEGQIDPLRDIGIINLELILADMQTVSKRLGNIERDVKRHVKEAVAEKEVFREDRRCSGREYARFPSATG